MTVDVEDDVFLLFGRVCIVCCKTALYQFDFHYRRFVSHEKLYQDCLAYNIECNCLHFLEKNLSCFNALCSDCQYNFLKMVSDRFIKIKSDYSSSTKNVY